MEPFFTHNTIAHRFSEKFTFGIVRIRFELVDWLGSRITQFIINVKITMKIPYTFIINKMFLRAHTKTHQLIWNSVCVCVSCHAVVWLLVDLCIRLYIRNSNKNCQPNACTHIEYYLIYSMKYRVSEMLSSYSVCVLGNPQPFYTL